MTNPKSIPPADDETRLQPGPAAGPATQSGRGSAAETSPTSSAGWLTSSGAIDHGRFPPGTLLGGRYRIVGRVGRGGMGEVFRADDLKLGQAVALKFLPPEVDRDPARLTQLHTEVRMARQVSHPNVCRVYDIDEVEGHTFLSMEYVDGEDLASLLRRIGRFAEDRGLEIARQICAGLAAAHERGVMHRDLKPANVMIDGTGRVRITDFGLAGATGETIRAGTPAYMAPEQLAGHEVTARSDIYALGLVLYELFTGRRALEGMTLAEVIRRREQGEIVPPSGWTHVSPEVDRAVMRCLAVDPASRPPSALAVAAALPGGDPLAAALAAGETPSPAMVAAAGEEGALRRGTGISLLVFTLLGLAAVAVATGRTLLVNRMTPTKSADVLEEKAREVLTLTGSGNVADTGSGVAVNGEYVRWVARTNPSRAKWDGLRDGAAPLFDFWYRTSPAALVPLSSAWRPQWHDPPFGMPEMATIVIDDQGRLVEFTRMPPQYDPSANAVPAVDWAPLFAAAGLPFGQFSAAAPEWTPRIYAEQRVAWIGPMPRRPDVQLRVEAASYRGRPVAFKVIGPWSTPSSAADTQVSTRARIVSAFGTVVVLTLLGGAVLLVRANLAAGRADRRGAGRIAVSLLVLWMTAWVLGARHTFDVTQETDRFFTALAFALLNVAFTWLFYLALEPFVRRLSPGMLIGWTRLLAGNFRDPRVGRDVLVGVATGVFFVLVPAVAIVVADGTGAAPQPQASNMDYFLGARYALSRMVRVLPNALQGAMLGTFFYVVLLAIVRRQWIAATVVLLFVTGLILAEAGEDSLWLTVTLAAVVGSVASFVFLRFGLLALATALYVNHVLHSVPLTADFTRPHAGISSVAILLVAALAVYAFHASGAGAGVLRRLVNTA